MMLSDVQVKAAILEFLLKKGRWGSHYFPIETLIRWLSKKVERDGKRVRKCIKELIDKGYILLHKKGRTVSLNPSKSKEILEFVEKVWGFDQLG